MDFLCGFTKHTLLITYNDVFCFHSHITALAAMHLPVKVFELHCVVPTVLSSGQTVISVSVIDILL